MERVARSGTAGTAAMVGAGLVVGGGLVAAAVSDPLAAPGPAERVLGTVLFAGCLALVVGAFACYRRIGGPLALVGGGLAGVGHLVFGVWFLATWTAATYAPSVYPLDWKLVVAIASPAVAAAGTSLVGLAGWRRDALDSPTAALSVGALPVQVGLGTATLVLGEPTPVSVGLVVLSPTALAWPALGHWLDRRSCRR